MSAYAKSDSKAPHTASEVSRHAGNGSPRVIRLVCFAGAGLLALLAGGLWHSGTAQLDHALPPVADLSAADFDSFEVRWLDKGEAGTGPAIIRHAFAENGRDFDRLEARLHQGLTIASNAPYGSNQFDWRLDFDNFEVRLALGHLAGRDETAEELVLTEAERPNRELQCLAQNIYFEARSEPDLGKVAVGQVVMNRVASKRFPGTICGVVRQGGEEKLHRCQFSWWCDGKSDEPKNQVAWLESLELAEDIYQGRADDPTDGALWYHADYVDPYWRTAFVEGPTIGRHIFYTPKTKTARTQLAKSTGD